MERGISIEALELSPYLKSLAYSCRCSNIFQCNHPSRMVNDDDIDPSKLDVKIKIVRGDARTYGEVLVQVTGTAGNLARFV